METTMNAMNDTSNLDAMNEMDALLDGTLDDLADIPEFKPFPGGAHTVTVSWTVKEIAGQMCPELTCTYVSAVELDNPEDVVPKAGDTCSVAYMFKRKDKTTGKMVVNELGQGQFKEVIKSLGEHFPGANPREIMEASKGAEVMVVTKIRLDKRDKDNIKAYTDIKSLQVV